jgi:hypothetical protein
MPLKTEILKHLDELTPATQATNACNTIVRVKQDDGSYKLVGTNTDVLGKFATRLSSSTAGTDTAHTRSPSRRKELSPAYPSPSTPGPHLFPRPKVCAWHRIRPRRRWRSYDAFGSVRSEHPRSQPHLPDQP